MTPRLADITNLLQLQCDIIKSPHYCPLLLPLLPQTDFVLITLQEQNPLRNVSQKDRSPARPSKEKTWYRRRKVKNRCIVNYTSRKGRLMRTLLRNRRNCVAPYPKPDYSCCSFYVYAFVTMSLLLSPGLGPSIAEIVKSSVYELAISKDLLY